MLRIKIDILLILALTLLTRLTAQAQIPTISQQQVDSLTAIVTDMPEDTTKAYALALICTNHPNADSTLKYAQELYSLSLKIGDKWKALAYRYLAWYCNINGDFEGSIGYVYKSLKINDSLGLKHEMALNYNSLGENIMNLGDYNTANEYFHNALELLIEINNTTTISFSFSKQSK